MRNQNAPGARPRTAPSSQRWRKGPSSPTNVNKVVFPRTAPGHLLDKALPPLPDTTRLPLPHSPSPILKSATPPAPAAANPALGLALTLDLPSTSLFDENTVLYDTSTSPTGNTASPVVRKAKSSQMLETDMGVQKSSSASTSRDRRPRGLSFSSSTLLGFVGDNKTKGKEKDVDGKLSPNLTRRGSFWSRKRNFTHSPEANVPSTPSSIAPTSAVHTSPSRPQGKQTSLHVRGLSRSLSERSFVTRPLPTALENGTSATNLSHRNRPSSAKLSQSPNWGGFLHTPSKTRNSKELNDAQQPSHSDKAQTTSRRRAQTNPPLLHRLSLNIFSFATSPPSPNPHCVPILDLPTSPSIEKLRTSILKSARDGESAAAYVRRVVSSVSKAEVAGILASSAESFYTQSLQIYIDRFDFVDDPLDIAMRKLLMHVGLPRETQQIDRVIEAFARRYRNCNPDLFTSDDHPYILAFSLIMLHTDAFNKSNKRKMTKADYVKNTKLPGLASEVLECFYDNIIFAPFIFIEDPLENSGLPMPVPDTPSRMFSSISTPSLVPNGNAGTLLKSNKIDPYYLIVHNLLSPLRVNVHSFVPPENPYSYEGTTGPWDIDQLQRDFTNVTVLLIDGPDQWQSSLRTHTGMDQSDIDGVGCLPYMPTSLPTTCALRITKVGVLNRKDDTLVGGKKAANRKWKAWTVVLTASHLFFFRDVSLASTLSSYLEPPRERVKLPDSVTFKPDESLTIYDSIAIYDQSYSKYPNTLRFVMSDGRQTLLQAPHEKESNDWLAKINYTSTFRTAQIRVRPPSMTGKLVELTGVAAATSHLQDMQRRSVHVHNWDNNTSSELSDTSTGSLSAKHPAESMLTSPRHSKFIAVAPEVEGADQFKATFDQVKADLAAGLSESGNHERNNPAAVTISSESHNGGLRLPSRAHVVQSRVESLQDDIAKAQSRIESDLQLVRNIGLLTPFQKATRDHLQTTLEVVRKRVAQHRINLVKLLCYHDTLCRDLSSEVRSWGEAKRIAFQAAKQTLQKHFDEKQLSSIRATADGDSHASKRSRSESIESSVRPSSLAESFYSAIDKLSSAEAISPSSPEDITSSPHVPHRDPTLGTRGTRDSTSSIRLSSSDASHDRSQTDDLTNSRPTQEEAEVWDKTRCAQRVSLVKVPSKLLLTRLPRGHST